MTEQELMWIITAAAGIVISLALGLILFFVLSQRKIQQEKLQRETLKTQFQRDLLAQTVTTQEEERNRIARELHDGVGAKLSVIKLNLQLMVSDLAQGNDISELVGDIDTAIQQSIDTSRSISHELMPPTLKKFGIRVGIEDLQHAINKTGKVHLLVNNLERCTLDQEMDQLHLFRVIQELVQNALKHANATHLYFTFDNEPNHLTLTYEDDGVGFPKDFDLSSGLGMSNLHTRIQLLRGFWHMDQEREHGAKIKIYLPHESL